MAQLQRNTEADSEKASWSDFRKNIRDGFIKVDNTGRMSLNIEKLTDNSPESEEKLKILFGVTEEDLDKAKDSAKK
jgi:glycosylphosphatidylinositol transamidase (GPIT) subunit GPI8